MWVGAREAPSRLTDAGLRHQPVGTRGRRNMPVEASRKVDASSGFGVVSRMAGPGSVSCPVCALTTHFSTDTPTAPGR